MAPVLHASRRTSSARDTVASRRAFLTRAAAGLGTAWVTPIVVTSMTAGAAAASILGCRVEFDGLCAELTPNTIASTCEPAGWAGAADCVGSPVSCSVGPGGELILSSATCMIVDAIAEDTGPAGAGCVTPSEVLPSPTVTLTPKLGNVIVVARAIVAC
ncbi:MAG: hypothetical protein OEU32_06260 [Acidimicrobiia bacterium]|nr:hypothetical protein [Acidimicrobiia bacterium]